MVDFAKIMADRRAQRGTTPSNGETRVPQARIGALPDELMVAPPAPHAGKGGFSRFRVTPASTSPAGGGSAAENSDANAVAPASVDVAGATANSAPQPPQSTEAEVVSERTESPAVDLVDPVSGRVQEANAAAHALATPVRRGSPFSAIAHAVALKEQTKPAALPVAADAPRNYEAAPNAFSRFAVETGAAQVAEARRDVHAVKVVVKLVAGIAFEPGSNASPADKIAALNERMDEMLRLARELAEQVSPGNQSNWVVGQCCEAVADMIGKGCERVGAFQDVPAAVRAVGEAIAAAGMDERVAEIVDELSHARYKPADDRDTAQARLMVSTASAVWDVFERVSSATILGQPYFFGRSALEITEALTASLHTTASERAITIADVDMQVSHFQGSIRRLATLIGAEYCAHVARVDAWVKQVAVGEREARLAALPLRIDDIVAESVSVATVNFVAVESRASQLLGMSQAREQQRVNEVAR
jgi:hypothetical protein